MASSDINIVGAITLYKKETHRFLKVYNQTLFAPVITSLLFLAIFYLAIGDKIKHIGDIPFSLFMSTGLIIMAVMQNAFANTSSSFVMGKVLGTIIDYLIPPISAIEITLAMVLAGITRGVMVGALVAIAVFILFPFSVHNIGITIFYLISASMLLALLGLLAGILSETFDHMAAVTSYIITPLSFLSGTFYSINNLPEFWREISFYNPFFYLIDGFRYGITGYSDSSILTGSIFITILNIFMMILMVFLINKGYRIKN